MPVRKFLAIAIAHVMYSVCLSKIGPSFPALTVLLAAWVPQSERGKLGTMVYGGGQVRIHNLDIICVFEFNHDLFLDSLDWESSIDLFIRYNVILLDMASGFLRLELYRMCLVHCVCKF